MRGVQAAQKHHEENTGLGYVPFVLKKSGDAATVRILQHQDEWVNLYMHQAYKKLKGPTRCVATWADVAGVETEDRSVCPLCMAEVPRPLRTFIPMRVRGDQNETRVQVAVYGRDGLQEVINQIEELPEGTDITWYDFKVKRQGSELDTKYFWHRLDDTKHELSESEKALEVPDMDETIPLLDNGQMANRAAQFLAAESVAAVEPSSNGNGKGRTPF